MRLDCGRRIVVESAEPDVGAERDDGAGHCGGGSGCVDESAQPGAEWERAGGGEERVEERDTTHERPSAA